MLQKSLQDNKIDYTVSCVSLFAARHNLSKKDAFQYLDKNNAISFLKQHYDIERHTFARWCSWWYGRNMPAERRKNLILYHGSNVSVEKIELKLCKPFCDFGRGFYLTDIQSQAEKMAERTARIKGGKPVLNIFEIDDNFLKNENLKIKDFSSVPTEEWALFVMNNRNEIFQT